jgi:Sec-independent protein secretion pathway component TatC
VAVPLLALYELGVLLARLTARGRRTSEAVTPAARAD